MQDLSGKLLTNVAASAELPSHEPARGPHSAAPHRSGARLQRVLLSLTRQVVPGDSLARIGCAPA